MKYNKKIISAIFLIFILGLVSMFSVFIKEEKSVVTEVKANETLIEKENIDEIIKVDIKGAVRNPGVYEVGGDNRVVDVIEKAGGLTKKANTDYINLSKMVENEMIIWIYTNDEIEDFMKSDVIYEYIEKDCNCPDVSTSACINNNTNNKELININKATKEELMNLSGLGESKELSIIEYRSHTPFSKIEDIKNVNGIGDSLFEKIKNYITV